MKHFVRRMIIAFQTFTAGKPLPVPYGIVDVAEVQPLTSLWKRSPASRSRSAPGGLSDAAFLN